MKKVIIGIVVVVILISVAYAYMMSYQKSQMANLVFEDIDMQKVGDGTYVGTAQAGFVNVETEVTVKDHKIANIVIIKHDNGLGSKAEEIIQQMIINNTYEVDAISGATASSEVIKSAVCNALMKGI